MSGITIVAALVRCSADLLLCNDIDTSALHFTDVTECTSRLPALIDEMQRVSAKGTVVMGRCRFQASRPTATTAGPAPRAKQGIGIDLAGTSTSVGPSP